MLPGPRDKEPWLDPQRRALLAALVVSLLAHHSVLSFISPPDLTFRNRRPRPVQVDLYEPAVPPATVAAPEPPPEPPPTAIVATLEPSPPPPPDETPAERQERLRRDREEMRLPTVPPPPHEADRPRPEPPQPEPPEREREQEQAANPEQQALNMHFVHLPPQTDESDEVPDDVRFFAQRTQDVDQETRARVTTLEGEEAPTAQAQARPDEEPAPNDGENNGRPQIDQRPGTDERDRTPTPAVRPQPTPVASQGGSAQGRPGPAQPPTPPPPAPQPQARPGGENGTGAETPVVAVAGVDANPQPAGTLAAQEQGDERVGRPGQGPDLPGGPPVEPVEPPPAVAAAGSQGAGGAGGSGGGPGSDTLAPNDSLRLDWSIFEELFHDQADRERQAFLEQRQERRRMGGAMDRQDRALAQLENFNPDVRPGNQTALDTLYHPFAEYLTAFHRKLHPFWGDGFLVSLTAQPDTHPLNDMNLWTKLEIVVNGDGTVQKITIVRSSGNTVYDVAAIDAVYQGEPYPEPPEELQSGDGRLYLHWSFYRNHSQCGVWNAEPFILPDPPSLHEEGEPGESEHPVTTADTPTK